MAKNYTNPFDGLMGGFEKMPNADGHMPTKPRALHATTMKPLGTPIDNGTTKGNPSGLGNPMSGALGSKGAQSAAQHAATVKAARASAAKRRRII
jgi:hypothetical protein